MRLPASPKPTSSCTTRWSIERVLALAGPQARLEFAGKRGGKPSASQADISDRLVELARAGQRVSCGSRAAILSCSGAAARRP